MINRLIILHKFVVPIEQSFEKLVSCEIFVCGIIMSLGPMLFVDNLSTRLISSLKLACLSSPGDISCWSISDLSAIVVRNVDGEVLFCFARCWLNPENGMIDGKQIRVYSQDFVFAYFNIHTIKHKQRAICTIKLINWYA